MEQQIINKYLNQIIERTQFGNADSDRHLLPFFSLGVASRGKVFVELGVREGTSTLPFLLAAKLNGGILYSVDIQDSVFICPPELRDNWKFIKMDALEFLKKWDPAKKIDIVLVDDWHTYPHVKKELDLLYTHITPTSLILLHDLMYGTDPKYHTNPGQNKGEWAFGGPYRAVARLSRREFEWATLPWHNGMTILRKKGGIISESRLRVIGGRLIRKYAPKYWESIHYLYAKIKAWFK